MPAGWRPYTDGTGTARADTGETRNESDYALQARALAAGAKAGAWTTVTLPRAVYEVRFWARADAGKTALVGAHLAGFDAPLATVGSADWEEYRQQVTLDKAVRQATLRVFAATEGVKVWIDDVEVVAVSALPE